MARFNAGLNAAVRGGPFAGRTLDLREGSLLEPLAGETFDLVVSNPPYVITPRSAGAPSYSYRDGGLAGDDVVRRLVEGVGVAAGARAARPSCWGTGSTGRTRPGPSGSGAGSTPAACTAGWCNARCRTRPSTPRRGPATRGTSRARPRTRRCTPTWLDDFAARGVEAVGFGIVTLRRPGSDAARGRVRRLEEHTGSVDAAMGRTVSRVLAAEEWLLTDG